MSADDNNCPACLRLAPEPVNFCPFCGANLLEIETLFAQIEIEEEEKERVAKPQAEAPPKRKRSKALPILGSIGVVTIGAAIIGSIGANTETSRPVPTSTSPSATESVTPTPTSTVVPFAEVASLGQTTAVAEGLCGPLADEIDVPDFLPRPAIDIAVEVDRVQSRSDARDYVSDNRSWINGDMQDEFQESLRAIVSPGVDGLISKLGLDTSDYRIDTNSWVEEFTDITISICQLNGELESQIETIARFQEELDRVRELAK